jgi:hypothetical protein
MGTEDIHNMEDALGRDIARKHFDRRLKQAKQMIRSNSGISQIEKLFISIKNIVIKNGNWKCLARA